MEEKDSLAVYYGKKFLDGAPGRNRRRPCPLDWQFTWAGHLCRIPALYVSDAGLTLACASVSGQRRGAHVIGGKIITLGGYESEEYFQKVASYINNKIAEL